MNPTPEAELTIAEAATALNVHPITLRRWVKAGKIAHVKRQGKALAIPESAIAAVQVGARHETVSIEAFRALTSQVDRLQTATQLLFDNAGFGTSLHGIGVDALTLLLQRTMTLLKSSGWTLQQKTDFAEEVLRLRESDVRTLCDVFNARWTPMYSLLLRMAADTPSSSAVSRAAGAKLDRAVGHLRSMVFALQRLTDPRDAIAKKLKDVAAAVGAETGVTTYRVLDWIAADSTAA